MDLPAFWYDKEHTKRTLKHFGFDVPEDLVVEGPDPPMGKVTRTEVSGWRYEPPEAECLAENDSVTDQYSTELLLDYKLSKVGDEVNEVDTELAVVRHDPPQTVYLPVDGAHTRNKTVPRKAPALINREPETDLEKASRLSRIPIDKDTEELAKDVGRFMAYYDKIKEVDVEDVPLFEHDIQNEMREDEVKRSFSKKEMEDHFHVDPEHDNHFVVPRVVE